MWTAAPLWYLDVLGNVYNTIRWVVSHFWEVLCSFTYIPAQENQNIPKGGKKKSISGSALWSWRVSCLLCSACLPRLIGLGSWRYWEPGPSQVPSLQPFLGLHLRIGMRQSQRFTEPYWGEREEWKESLHLVCYAAAERLFSCVFNLVPFFNCCLFLFFLLKRADFILGTTLLIEAKRRLFVWLKMSIIYWLVTKPPPKEKQRKTCSETAVKFRPPLDWLSMRAYFIS